MSTPVVALTSSTWGAIIPFVLLSRRHLDVEGHAHFVVNGRVLLVTRLKVSVARVLSPFVAYSELRFRRATNVVGSVVSTLALDV